MTATDTYPEELSAFVRNALRQLTPTSTITFEHTTLDAETETVIDRATVGPETLRALDTALRSGSVQVTRPEGYLQAPAVARILGIKTGTLAKWRRLGTGPKGWLRMNRTFVASRNRETTNANRHTKIQTSCSWLEMGSTN